MPWDPNTGANQGVASANQSHLQTLLEGLREKAESARFQAENLVDVDPSNLHPAAKAFGTPLPNGLLRFNKSVLPTAAAAGEKALAREQSVQEQTATANAIDTLHPPGGEPMPQELRGPYAMLRSGVPAHPDALKAAVDYLAGKKNLTTLKPGERAYDSATQKEVMKNAPDQSGPPKPADLGHYWRESYDQMTGGSKWEHVPMNAQQLFLASQQERDPQKRKTLLDAADYAKLVPVPEGGDVYGGARAVAGRGGPVPAVPGAPGPDQPAGPPRNPGSLISRPDKPESAEVDRVSGSESFSRNARSLADDLERTLPDTKTRLGFALRARAQGVPYARAAASLSPEEQGLLTRADNLRLDFEKTKGGVRMAASPQMYDRISTILTDPSSATAPAALRAASNMVDQDVADYRRVAVQANRRPIGGAPAAPAKTPSGPPSAGVSGTGPKFDPAADARARAKYGLSGR